MKGTAFEAKMTKRQKKAIKMQLTLELSKLWGAKRLQEYLRCGMLKWVTGF